MHALVQQAVRTHTISALLELRKSISVRLPVASRSIVDAAWYTYGTWQVKLKPHGSQSIMSTRGCNAPAHCLLLLCSGLLDQANPADVMGAASDIAGSASDLAGSALDVAGSVQGSVGDSLDSIGTFWGSIVDSVSSAKEQVTAKTAYRSACLLFAVPLDTIC